MNWQPLAPASLIQSFQPAERAALEAAEAKGGTPLAEIARQTADEITAEIRMYIAGGGRCTLPQGNAKNHLPAGLIAPATALFRYTILARFALNISEPRKQAYADARETLGKIAAGEIVPTEEDTITPHPAYTGRPSKIFGVRRTGII